ncbi:putative major facilitator superfamily transporter protein [Phaeoacremonium minimum UCRPA7]|uniref:Putative major facilitator superfamily transporter protein n=1 Tax=Phaeoacremonium minimum (strain UCR-PA7) TaxID=1286976 RepID=R8BSM8_PHAM7|nr:putative major facilitator superfamily transporter protein [Phaeoacremonium minimum UCRPA7]EOO02300.1 putative major facilitator superfamily transporter protein [Phaeoacremonium minimum UCRPA7]
MPFNRRRRHASADDEAREGLLQPADNYHDHPVEDDSIDIMASHDVKPPWQRVKSRLVWFQKQETTPLERDLVRRLDLFLMSYGCISQVIKYLDQTNISSAYVSGMKEDLGLYGNELNYFSTFFNVSYCLMLIPSQVILTYVRPSYWLPGLEIGWGVITGLIALAQNAKHVYVLRVFLGLFESSAWPGMMTLFMYWYTPTELAKRMAIYHSCQAIGYMMSGALQVALLETMNGTHGLPGWRWLFVINAIMTVCVGLAGFFMLPDYPNMPNPRAFWFNSDHARAANERLERHGRAEAKRITWASAKRTTRMWVAYFVPILYMATVLASYGYNYFNLFLKSLKNADGTPVWSTSKVNAIPIAGGGINVFFVWVWAILSDLFQTRWTLIIAQAVIGLLPAIIMSIWTRHPNSTPISAAYASYFMSYLCLGTAPLIMSWLSDLLPQDPEARTLILGYAIAGVYAILAWSQVLVWPASQAPYYKYAWQSCIALWALVLIMTCLLHFVDIRYLLPRRLAAYPAVIDGAKQDDDEQVEPDRPIEPESDRVERTNPKRTEVEAIA